MNYHLLKHKEKADETYIFPCLILRRDSWDDFGYKTTFILEYCPAFEDKPVEIGVVKILRFGQAPTYTELTTNQFNNLGPEYCSLGQSEEYYEEIKRLNLAFILHDLRDVCSSHSIKEKFADDLGFSRSLLRSSRAMKILENSDLEDFVTSADFSFIYTDKLIKSKSYFEIFFDFKYDQYLPYRINVIVGRNGTGKSQILSKLALLLSGFGPQNEFFEMPIQKTGTKSFRDAIVISYSPFDVFRDVSELNDGKVTKNNLKGGFIPYKFFGIRKHKQVKSNVTLKSHRDIKKELRESLDKADMYCRRDILIDSLNMITTNKTLCPGITPEFIIKNFDKYSNGQKIMYKIIFDLIGDVQKNDLILFDEPETYLHPQAISTFFNCFRYILSNIDAYAIIATHSPVIIQETPSRYVNIVQNRDNNTYISKPVTESLGQNLGSLTVDVFGFQIDDLNFYDVLDKFIEQKMTLQTVEEKFGRPLETGIKMYYMSRFEGNE